MIFIACVDDDLGMMFNSRRQSRDRAVYERISAIFGIENLKMSEYSKCLFNNLVLSKEKELSHVDAFFVENPDDFLVDDHIDKIVLYYWNRKYPSDRKLNIDLNDYICISETQFAGTSHDKITEKIFVKK